MSDAILIALAVLGPAAAAVLWIRRGAQFGTACWIYALSSIPLWLVITVWTKEPGRPILHDLAFCLAATMMGAGMGTLIFFVPGWLIGSGTKGIFEDTALYRSTAKLLGGLFLYAFWALVFFATRGQ